MGTLDVQRCGYALGARVTGLDLARPLDAETVARVREALLEHVVLVLPGQDIGAAAFAAFCRQFGELDDNRGGGNRRHPDDPHVIEIANDVAGRTYSTADSWHTDYSFGNHPATITFLLAKDLPDTGGNTMFANMYAAYESLSPAFQEMIDPLEGIFDFKTGIEYAQASPADRERMRAQKPVAIHRLVRTHPETGRKALYLSDRIRNFVGMTAEETKPILAFLGEQAARYELSYRHVWSRDELVMWDQRCSLHMAVVDYDEHQLRRMLRCTLLGPKSGRLEDESAASLLAAGAAT